MDGGKERLWGEEEMGQGSENVEMFTKKKKKSWVKEEKSLWVADTYKIFTHTHTNNGIVSVAAIWHEMLCNMWS